MNKDDDKILAVDPGSHHTGLLLFDGGNPVLYDRINPPAKADRADRMAFVAQGTLGFLAGVETAAAAIDVVIEWPPHMRGRPGQEEVYGAAGAVIGATWRAQSHTLVRPAEWKRDICGVENGTKAQTEAVLRQLYADDIRARPEWWSGLGVDVWDALGIGLWYIRDQQAKRRLEEAKRGTP